MTRRNNDDRAGNPLKAQIIADTRGEPAFVVLPIEGFAALLASARAGDGEIERAIDHWTDALRDWSHDTPRPASEDAEDVAAYDAALARDEESFSAEVAERLIAGDAPLKVFREHRGLTQRQLADKADTAAAYVSQIETGRRVGSIAMLRRLAHALDLEIDDLV